MLARLRQACAALLAAAAAVAMAALPFMPEGLEREVERPAGVSSRGADVAPPATEEHHPRVAVHGDPRPEQRPAPACGGRDLFGELAADDPARHRIETEAARTPNAGALLWRLERPGRPASHLFGTIHVSDDRVNALSLATRAAHASARQVALEVADLSSEALDAALKAVQHLLVDGDGRSLATQLDAAESAAARRALERAGMPGGAIEWVRPWVVTMTLSLTECERQRSVAGLKALDARLADGARQRGTRVVGLETFEDQLRALAGVPADDQLTVLKASLKLEPIKNDMIETLVRLYLGRRLGHVWPLQEEMWRRAGFAADSFASFRRELITRRNLHMRDAALPLLEAGNAFIAVGALHLPGEEGLVELLRLAGWSATAVD